ncbi:hypothetical protein IKD82_02530 [Candidatus Saccharibacteria bacterium]|nr:hypothetical protein [Candidatus Saccharibacteria bacterium]
MVFGLSGLEINVNMAFLDIMSGYPDIKSHMEARESLYSEFKKFDWVDRISFIHAYDFFRLSFAFYTLLTDDDKDKTIQKIQKYLKSNFIKQFKIDETTFEDLFYDIEIEMRLIKDDNKKIPKNYMPANVFWNIYDHFADRSHKSPSKIGAEIEFSNTTLKFRQFTIDNISLTLELYLLMVESLNDARRALKRL